MSYCPSCGGTADEGCDVCKPPEPQKPQTPTYLGDSVYADLNEWGAIVLTTNNGLGPTNTIVMEPEVLYSLQVFIRACEDWIDHIRGDA